MKKEIEKPKFRPSDVVAAVNAAGFTRFRVTPEHWNMWKAEDAKKDGKGYGVNIAGVWYWCQTWTDRCIELCKAADDMTSVDPCVVDRITLFDRHPVAATMNRYAFAGSYRMNTQVLPGNHDIDAGALR